MIAERRLEEIMQSLGLGGIRRFVGVEQRLQEVVLLEGIDELACGGAVLVFHRAPDEALRRTRLRRERGTRPHNPRSW